MPLSAGPHLSLSRSLDRSFQHVYHGAVPTPHQAIERVFDILQLAELAAPAAGRQLAGSVLGSPRQRVQGHLLEAWLQGVIPGEYITQARKRFQECRHGLLT